MQKNNAGQNPKVSQSQPLSISRGNRFFLEKKGATAALVLGLTACGGGGGGSSEGANTGNTPVVPPITAPVNVIPTANTSYIELGPIAGGTVQFQTLGGTLLSTGGTKSDGSLDYNPRDIVSKMGTDQWLLIQVSGGQDTDVDDDGVTDAVFTPLRGSFRMLVPRSALETGEKVVVNPRSGLISETILAKNANITIDLLDAVARQSGANDQNNDGIINYRDTYSIRMKDVTGVSKIVPATSGYIASIHSGNPTAKTTALSNVARTENHIVARIVPSANTYDHTPSLELTASSPGASILYTLDLSSPVPGGSTTRVGSSKLVIPFQNAKVYYREYATIGGQVVLGKVVGFDLSSDWTELAQSNVSYNSSGSAKTATESLTYKNIPYIITTLSNSVSSGYTYPKTISCQVGVNKDAGCQYGPYMVWSPEHESRVRGMIDTAVKTYIDTPGVVVPVTPVTPIVLVDFYRNNVSYNGATYIIQNTWTQGANNTKIFPVKIQLAITRKNGQVYIPNPIQVTTQTELTSTNIQVETEAKRYIDADNIVTPPAPTHSQNHAVSYTNRVNNYYGGFYEVWSTYNLDGKSDFPVQISGIYGVQNQGTKTPSIMMAANETERIQKSNQMVADIQRLIQAGYNATPAPTFSQNYLVPSSFVSYRGYGYQLLTTMNITGTSDYPASVRVIYTTPLSSNNTTQTINANSATELSSVQVERINDAKARIDLIVNADQYPPNYVEIITGTTTYGGGSYYSKFTYSGNLGQDYPGYVDTYITYRNGSSDKLTISVDNANQKTSYASNLEGQARLQIDNYNPTFPVNLIGSDGPYAYGNKGSEYTYKVKYNRVGTGTNYPALVWIEYKSKSTGALQDTRTTYGNTIANSSVERDQIKATLTTFVKGQMVALSPTSSDTIFATKWKIEDFLPISTAHAAPSSSLVVQKSYAQLPNFSPLNSNTTYGKFFAGGSIMDHFVRNENGKGGVAANSSNNLALQVAISGIRNSTDKINQYWGQCTVGGEMTLLPAGGCVQHYEKIRQEEIKIQKLIGVYLQNIGETILPNVASTANYMYGLRDGAVVSIYSMASLGIDILDGDAVKKVGDWYTTKMYPYFYENSFDFRTYYNDGTTSVLGLSNELLSLTQEVIGLETDPYRRGYLIGSIGATVGTAKILGTAANAAVMRMKGLGQLVATVESMPVTVKQTQLLNTLRAKMVQEVVVKFNSINTVEDIQAIAKVNTISDLTQKAYIVIGTEETAQGVINFLKNKNWVVDGKNPQSITYTSPDGLQRVNFRTVASSEVPGYQTRVTFDLLRKVGNDFKKIPGNAEVKFVFPNK